MLSRGITSLYAPDILIECTIIFLIYRKLLTDSILCSNFKILRGTS